MICIPIIKKLGSLYFLFYFQTAPLDQMLYLADNLSYFPYQVQDEPLFIIHHIDIIISTSGSNLLQAFREVTKLYPPLLKIFSMTAVTPV